LDGERPRQRLTDGDGFAHLLLGQPTPLSDQFPFHLTHERDRPAKAKKAEPQKIDCKFTDAAAHGGLCRCHAGFFLPSESWVIVISTAFASVLVYSSE
jgi:hypothetical protein